MNPFDNTDPFTGAPFKTNYAERTVSNLKELCRARGVRIPHNATKARLISELTRAEKKKEPTPMIPENHKTTKEEEPKKKSAKELEADDIQPTRAARNALEPVDKSDERWFQTGAPGAADGRELLTKEEARAKGFHWLDTDDDAEAKKK